MRLFPLVYGMDGDKKLFLDCGYRGRQGEIHVYHTFDCLLGDGRWRVGDETELGRISHFYIVDAGEKELGGHRTLRIYAAIRISPIGTEEYRRKEAFESWLVNVFGYHNGLYDARQKRVRSGCDIDCIAIYLGDVDLNVKRLRNMPPLDDCGYQVADEIRRRYHQCTSIIPAHYISMSRMKPSGLLMANSSVKRGCVVKLPSVLRNTELNVIAAYDDVLVVAPVPDQDSVRVSIDNDTHGSISRQRGSKLIIDDQRYDLTRKRLDVVSKPVRGYTNVRILFGYNRYQQINETDTGLINYYRYHVPIIDEYELCGIEIDNDNGDDCLKEYTFRVRNKDIDIVKCADGIYDTQIKNNLTYRIAKAAGICLD